HGGEGGDVGAGAVEHGECLCLRAEDILHHLGQARRVLVFTVGDLVAAVGGGNGIEHFGVDAGVVVAGESAGVQVVELVHSPILAVTCLLPLLRGVLRGVGWI